MKILLFGVLVLVSAVACQSAREKDAILVKDRIEKLSPLSHWTPMECQVKTELAPQQAQKYIAAFPDEKDHIENWDVTYDWTALRSRCEVHPQPLTPASANQRAFMEEALCTLMQVFWVHSPFDDLKIDTNKMEDTDKQIFLRENDDSDVGLRLGKSDVSVESRTRRKGTYSARYALTGGDWLPAEIKHETLLFQIQLRDFEWNQSSPRTPPKSFWIYVGDRSAPTPHTHVEMGECKPLY